MSQPDDPPIRLPADEEVWHQGGYGQRTEAAWHLLSLLSGASEDAYCATWMSGLEYTVWYRGVSCGRWTAKDDSTEPTPDRWADIPDGFCWRVVALAELLDVWWWWRTPPLDAADYFTRNGDHGPRSVRLATWRRMLDIGARITKRDARQRFASAFKEAA